DLAALLASDPARLADRVATPESFRERPIGAGSGRAPLPVDAPLKLFQPVHGQFHLVAASLVCRAPGLPDRAVNVSRRETTGFVLRRLETTGAEMAWVTTTAGARAWQTLTAAQAGAVAAGEELLP